jgi:phosphate acetyltransferase
VLARQPDLAIDGEMQLDAAVNEAIGSKKAPTSKVAGRANILILPDLNAGNILYKSMEQFGSAHAYGPLLQGFNAPVSDLSRGSSIEDVLGVIAITAARLSKS